MTVRLARDIYDRAVASSPRQAQICPDTKIALEMKVGIIFRLLLLLVPLTPGVGCMTHALWDNGNLEAVKEPAGNLNLRLFDAKPRNDLLVVYDEYSERSDTVRTRAYWLNKNQERVDRRRAPDFVSTNVTRRLSAVPVFNVPAGGTNLPPTFYALVAADQKSFSLYSGDRKIGSHDLPTYNDGKGRVEKMALTPVAVTADLTIVGGYLGCWFVYGLAQSGYTTH
jgi:hypothetical protein